MVENVSHFQPDAIVDSNGCYVHGANVPGSGLSGSGAA